MRPEVGETAGKGSPQESARVPANTRGCARKKANSELLTFIYWWWTLPKKKTGIYNQCGLGRNPSRLRGNPGASLS